MMISQMQTLVPEILCKETLPTQRVIVIQIIKLRYTIDFTNKYKDILVIEGDSF